jgi:hypothetical protein
MFVPDWRSFPLAYFLANQRFNKSETGFFTRLNGNVYKYGKTVESDW